MDEHTHENGNLEEELTELYSSNKVTDDCQDDSMLQVKETNGKNSTLNNTGELIVDSDSKLDVADSATRSEYKSDEEEQGDSISEATGEKDDVSSTEMEEENDDLDHTMLSIHLRPEELGLFDDLVEGRDNEETANSIKSMSEGSIDVHLEVNTEERLYERKSDLYCALCGELCKDARLLRCLHTFCLECLKKRSKERYRYVFCPLCSCRTVIPVGYLSALPKNLVVTNVISTQSALTQDMDCIICKLGGVDTLCVARCLDCSDLLCEECSGKHTFSHQTAKHTVIRLDEDNLEESAALKWSNRIVNCKVHRDEVVKFYCEKCSECVCKDCIALKHSSHCCVELSDIYKKTADHTINSVKQLKEQTELITDFDTDLTAIETEEKKQLKILEDAKLRVFQAVERKFEHCVAQLQQAFKKRVEFYRNRQQIGTKTKTIVGCIEENVKFILENANSAEMISLEGVLNETFASLEKDVKSVSSAVLQGNNLPKVDINDDNIKVMSSLSLFSVAIPRHRRTSHNSDTRQSVNTSFKQRNVLSTGRASNTLQSGVRQNKSGNRNFKDFGVACTGSNTGKLQQNVSNNAVCNVKTVLPGNGPSRYRASASCPSTVNTSAGRGRLLQSINTGSILGEYPGYLKNFGAGYQNLRPQQSNSDPFETAKSDSYGQKQLLPNNYIPSGFKSQLGPVHISNSNFMNQSFNERQQSKRSVGQRQQRHSGGYKPGKFNSEVISLKLRGSVNTSVLLEQSEPNVVGVAFTSPSTFAVCDGRNRRVKLFDVQGMFLTVVEDDQPMTITVCKDHLIWNSHFSDIQIYSFGSMTRFDLCKFSEHACHPVTTFKGEKLMVANVHETDIEAFQLEGTSYKLIHSLRPKDREGRPLKKVTHIAAYANDLLAIIDSCLKKVVVNNFDGTFIGEYSASHFDPGGICIDHKDTIFVTNRVKNKLIALTSHGELIQEWTTFIDSPTAVACNGRGLLLVAGQGKTVSIYQYE